MQQEIEYAKLMLYEELEVCLYTIGVSHGIAVIQLLVIPSLYM